MSSTRFQNATRMAPTANPGWNESTGFTITGWVNPHSAEYVRLITASNDSYDMFSITIDSTNRIYINSWASGANINPDEWLFLSVTVSDDIATLNISTDYETLSSAGTQSIGEGWSILYLRLGGVTGFQIDGYLHHVRVFNHTLSEAEIITELTSATAVSATWAAWELENAKINDYSGNGRHLTGSGGAITTGSSSSPPQPNNTTTIGSSF